MMNEQQIKDLLFGRERDVPLPTISSLQSLDYLPPFFTRGAVARWRNTFIGAFVMKYPKFFHIIKEMEEVLGEKPLVSHFTEYNLKLIVERMGKHTPNTAHQYCTKIKCAISELLKNESFNEEVPCKRWRDILSSIKGCPTTKTYMNEDDIRAFLRYKPQNETERICHARFAVELMTGARMSDVERMTTANVQDGVLTYVPQKTKSSSGKVVSIPVSELTVRFIEIASQSSCKYHDKNEVIREICRKCGLDEEVTYFYAGKYVTKPKWQAIRSHIGRVSFVTNLIKLGQPIHEVSNLAGHTDIEMTLRYNASTEVNLTKEANDFINMKI